MAFWGLVLAIIVLSLLSGAAGGYWCVRKLGQAKQATPLSETGRFCEVCSSPALPHRCYDGRWLCAVHKGRAA